MTEHVWYDFEVDQIIITENNFDILIEASALDRYDFIYLGEL